MNRFSGIPDDRRSGPAVALVPPFPVTESWDKAVISTIPIPPFSPKEELAPKPFRVSFPVMARLLIPRTFRSRDTGLLSRRALNVCV